LAIAAILAYLLDPVIDFFEHKGVSRPRAILCVFAIGLALLLGLFGAVVPQLVAEAQQLAQDIPSHVSKLESRVDGWMRKNPIAPLRRILHPEAEGQTPTNLRPPPGSQTNPTDTNAPTTTPATTPEPPSLLSRALESGTLQSATEWLARILPKVGSWLFGQIVKVASWFGVLAGLALIPVYAFYLLLEKRGIKANWADYLPVANSHFKDELVFVIKSINDYLIAFFRGQVLVAICDGALYTLGFALVGVPYALLIGALATVLTMIPFLGAITTCATALVLTLIQYGDWQHPILVLVVFGIVQLLEGIVISPTIMGNRVGLHPLTIIVAIMVGTTLLGGILGAILAIPVTAALRTIMFRYVWKRPDQ
jgi:predicted PurR-regulated permease PerM